MARVGMTTTGGTASGMFIPIGVTIDDSSVKQSYQYLRKFREKAEKEGKIELKIDYDKATGAKKQLETLQLATGEYVRVLSKLNSQGEITDQVIIGMGKSANSAASGMRNLSNAQSTLNGVAQKSTNIFKDFNQTFLKMAKFNTINKIYDGLINKMSEAIQITNQFDEAMTEFKKVTDTSNLSLSEYTETLGQLGELTARSATQMLEAATEFSKGGFTPEESARLAQVATLYQNIADAEISAGDAASFIISQMKAFGVEANNATSILDKVNEVSNNFAVSSTDIASALTKQSASLAAYGNDLNESIALT